MKYIWLLLAICIVLGAWGYAQSVDLEDIEQQVPPVAEQVSQPTEVPQAAQACPEGIEKVFKGTVECYQNKEEDEFLENISKEYYPDYEEFERQVEDFFINNNNIELNFVIEKVLANEETNTQSIDAKWFKTYADRAGNLTKLEGFAILIFDISGEEPVLIDIKEDNPFTE